MADEHRDETVGEAAAGLATRARHAAIDAPPPPLPAYPDPTPPTAGTMHPSVAGLLSAVVPGAGQWYARRPRRALAFGAVTIGLGVPATVLGVLAIRGGAAAGLDLLRPFFETPGLLWWILVVNVVVAVFRALAAADAFTVARRSGRPINTWMAIVTLAVVGVLVALPHVWAGQRIVALHDLLTFDFATTAQAAVPYVEDEVPPPASTTTLPSTTVPATTTTAPAPTTTVPPTTAPPTTMATTVPPTTVTTLPPTTTTTLPPLADRRVNVLLLGGDAAPDRDGVRTDTMILVSVDPVSGDTAMFSVPRNMRQVPIPEGHPAYDVWDCHCYPDLINALYQTGLNRPESFPGGPNTGANAIMTVLSSLYGIDIHHYAFVDLLGFVAVVDALGGLDITATEWVVDEEYIRPDLREVDVNYVPGRTYHMDGNEALAYARIRRNSSDYYRMGRQRCVLQAAAQQANPVTLIRNLPELVDALQGALLTDIPVAEWPAFIELAAASDAANAVTVRFMPYAPELKGTGLDYNAGWVNGGYPTPNVSLIQSTVRTVISTPAPDAAVEIGVESLGDICGTA